MTAVAALTLQEVADLLPTREERRDYIDRVESAILAVAEIDRRDAVLEHSFQDGLYTRRMTLPADVTLTGLVHRKSCLTVLEEGQISVLTEEGAATLTAPAMFWSRPGLRRLGQTHTPVVWTTIHAVQATDLDAIEAELFAFDYLD
jgi:hypothetical protein